MLPNTDKMTVINLDDFSLISLARRCQEESQRFFQRLAFDQRYCYELFRRAIVLRINQAWELLYTQYAPQVQGWVERHAAFRTSGEDAFYFVNLAFEKMWAAVNPQKFAQFPDLKSLLRYLQMCVHSVMIDHARARSQPGEREAAAVETVDAERAILADERRQELWRLVQERLHNLREQRLIYYRFVLDLMPRTICQRFPDDFPKVDEVYVMLQNIIARLRRDPNLRKFLGEDD
jgi:DNA-directed RNA polymerase specialized sigma24 family protein